LSSELRLHEVGDLDRLAVRTKLHRSNGLRGVSSPNRQRQAGAGTPLILKAPDHVGVVRVGLRSSFVDSPSEESSGIIVLGEPTMAGGITELPAGQNKLIVDLERRRRSHGETIRARSRPGSGLSPDQLL